MLFFIVLAHHERRNFKGMGDADYLKQQIKYSFATKEGSFADDIKVKLENLIGATK
tara:strand:- start:4099 stop:4266 length:168 start_codon:yes stop_codon:yes gene_type:complete